MTTGSDVRSAGVPENTADGPPPATAASRLGMTLQVALSLILVGIALVYLLFMPGHDAHSDAPSPERAQVVEPLDGGRLAIDMSSRLADRITRVTVESQIVRTPIVRATGTVVASLRPGKADDPDFWQFDDPELLATFNEWRRALVDIEFAEAQLERFRELSEVRVSARQKIVDRLQRLVSAGTDSVADLELARAELLEAEIEGRQETHEAETTRRLAQQEEAIQARQLELAGLDPDLLLTATSDIDVVVAEVPERYAARVRIGQECEARFFGMPQQIFRGEVRRIAPVLTREMRSLRVVFFVDDRDDQLRPGMFAEIGVGTDPHEALLVPEVAVIHIGYRDYLFTATENPEVWQVTEVEVGDTMEGHVEVLAGLTSGTEVISQGAILLKPAAAASLQRLQAASDPPPRFDPDTRRSSRPERSDSYDPSETRHIPKDLLEDRLHGVPSSRPVANQRSSDT